MNDNKYYTPKLEEFHVGFEFEYKKFDGTKKTIFELQQINWTKSIVKSINDLPYIERGLDPANVRVKYLDREDLESLGFHFRETNKMSYWYDYKNNIDNLPGGYKVYSAELLHDPDRNTIKITFIVEGEKEVFFEGFIKNKSELKKLLKQLGINE